MRKLELAFEQAIEDSSDAIGRLLVQIVTEDDRAGLGLLQDRFDDVIFSWLRPVARIDTPENHADFLRLRNPDLVFAKGAVGRAQPCGAMIQQFTNGVLRHLDFPIDPLVGQRVELEMIERVVADLVALGQNALRQLGRLGDALANHEKRRVQIALLELVEHDIGHAGRGAVVERDRDALARAGAAADEMNFARIDRCSGRNGGVRRGGGRGIRKSLRRRGDARSQGKPGDGSSQRLQELNARNSHDLEALPQGHGRASGKRCSMGR